MNSETITTQTYISSISHELKAPINVITGSCQIACLYIDDKDKVSQCLSKINIASNHLTELINNVLTMADMEQGHYTANNLQFDMNCLIDELTIMLQPLTHENNIHLQVNSNAVIHNKVIGDYRHLLQILINIISNAIKYSFKNEQVLLEITESASSKCSSKATYRFTCIDKGIGMSKEFLSKIFEPFARSEEAVASCIKGSGLGMSIVKKIVDMLGGKIEISSLKGSGTTVAVEVDMDIICE